MSDREQKIREIAFRIWEEEGRPLGHAERHWEMAERIVAEEEAKQPGFAHRGEEETAAKPAWAAE
ncbi:MAG TPA: DUF2934 domain-containing protein [Roseiarcus sp.]|nr:DUF2934 domain-containing protein [Roseiarcus sp.]